MTEVHTGAARDPGRMTAAMRVLPLVAAPKVLRIAIASEGRIVDERLMKSHQDVTVGEKESCTFVLASPVASGSFRLFEFQSGSYYLNVLDGMGGSVDLGNGLVALESLRVATYRKLDGSYRMRLAEGARGKIVIGRSIVLFQFVDAPVIQPRPQLPTSVRAGVSSNIDWRFTVIASFSFVLHFGLLGMLYSDWADQQIDEVAMITGVVDTVMSLPAVAPPPDLQAHETVSDGPQSTREQVKPGGTNVSSHPPTGSGRQTSVGGKQGMSASDKAVLSQQLEQMDVGIIATLNQGGSATQGVLRSSDNPTGPLEQIAAANAGVRNSNGVGLHLGEGNGRIVRDGTNDLSALAPPPGSAAPVTTGSSTVIKPPPPSGIVTAQPQGNGGSIRNLESVVSRLRSGFRQCYMKVGLEGNPDMEGSVRVTAVIGANGEVTSVQASPSGTISSGVASCIAARVRGAQFDPPQGGTATVIIPVQLRHQ